MAGETHPSADLEATEHDAHVAKCAQTRQGQFWPKELHPNSCQFCACGQVQVGPGEHWHTFTSRKCHTVEACT